LLATPLRAQLRRRWFWLGTALALLLAAPNLLWNAQNGWPSLAFYRSRPTVDLPASVAEALVLQLKGASPAVLWIPGALYLLFARTMRSYRPLGIAFLVVFVVMLFSGQRRADRIVGIYPVVVAAGATAWDRWRGRWHGAVRIALLVCLVAVGAAAAPALLPVLPPQTVADYFQAIGEKPEYEAADVGAGIPIYLLGRLEWERLADEVMAAWETLSAEERARSVVLAPHWVYASVVEYYARHRGLAPVVSPHNAYWFWRRDAAHRDVVVAIGIAPETLSRYFEYTRPLAAFRCAHCAVFRPDLSITVAARPIRPLTELLSEWRHFSIQPAPALLPLPAAEPVREGGNDALHDRRTLSRRRRVAGVPALSRSRPAGA
jgi:hypothetical protein